MNSSLLERLNQVEERIASPEFLAGKGIGNEIACYIFDYPATEELTVRESITLLLRKLELHPRGLRVSHFDLFNVVIDYLEHRGYLQKAIEMQKSKGDAAMAKALKGILAAEKIRDFMATQKDLPGSDLILISGVGRVWPMLRAHSLLNCLHTAIGDTPLVMFHPGSFSGTSLKLFGEHADGPSDSDTKPYYRAFSLLPS